MMIIGNNRNLEVQILKVATPLNFVWQFNKMHSKMLITVMYADTDQKVGYAKRMARAHLKSVGIGEFTPKLDSYCRNSGEREADDELQDLGGGKPRWKKVASDEFDF